MEYDKICYKKTCLSKVIIRLDFIEYINSEILFNDSVMKEVLGCFPRKGMQQSVYFQTTNMMVNPTESITNESTQKGILQEFSNNDGDKIILSNRYIILEIVCYKTYEDAIEKLTAVLKTVFERVRLTTFRTGIRYINEFRNDRIKSQKNYFTSPASALADSKIMVGEKIMPNRAMALNEYLVDDMHLYFRYGQYNPYYPQPFRQLAFVLDYDCYCLELLQGLESVLEHLRKGHDSIQELFESTITDKLREVMYSG